jgi:3-hydroxyacyl-CoA dehydrogenase
MTGPMLSAPRLGDIPAVPALAYLEQAERAAGSIPELLGVEARAVERVGIVGCGAMGRGIAMACANGGYAVRLVDVDSSAVATALRAIRGSYERAVARGRLTPAEAEARIAAIAGAREVESLGDVDLAIEAVFESLDVKSEVFRALDRVCRPGTLLASNTSNLDIDVLASRTRRPGDVLGTHFFAPAHVMRLVEIVRGRETRADVLATAMAFAHRLGKIGVVVGVCFGFVGNRMAAAYGEEAARLLYAGATPWQIDRALERFGLPMGPFRSTDLSGLDVDWRARRERVMSEEQRLLARIDDLLFERGRLGQKSGAGFYLYPTEGHDARPDPDVERWVREIAAAAGIEQRDIGDDEIVERCLLQMINAGAEILDAGLAARAGDIDAVFANGFGFPRDRGGPMYLADRIGASAIVAAMNAYRATGGAEWAPAPLLLRAAADGRTIASLARGQR